MSKAIVCHAPEDLRLDTFESDTLGPHQLAVRVAYGGICGSDPVSYTHLTLPTICSV